MDISIIILSYNTRDLLRECLESLVKITTGQNNNDRKQDVHCEVIVEVIVIDNASPDGSAQVVEQEFPQVKLIRSDKNLGFAAGNNLGAKNAKGEFLFFLNSDTRIEDPELFEKIIVYMRQHPEIGILAPQLVNPDGSLQKSGRSFPSFLREICYYSGLWGLNPMFFSNFFDFSKHKDFTKIQAVEDAGGAAIMIHRELFERLGGWDEYFFMYYEDADLSQRVWQAGRKVIYFPTVKVMHHQGQSEKVTPGASKYLWESLPKYAQKWWPKWQVELLELFLGFKKKL